MSLVHDNLTKVQLSGPDGEVETLWARPVGGDEYELDNIPWYAYGVSCHDVIEARRQTPDGFPEFVRVVRKAGHRTVRVILNPPADVSAASQAVLDGLRDLGCGYEGVKSRFMAVDVPPAVDLMAVRQFLIGTGLQWEHADPTYQELFPGDSGEH
jgi:hypothetical protein